MQHDQKLETNPSTNEDLELAKDFLNRFCDPLENFRKEFPNILSTAYRWQVDQTTPGVCIVGASRILQRSKILRIAAALAMKGLPDKNAELNPEAVAAGFNNELLKKLREYVDVITIYDRSAIAIIEPAHIKELANLERSYQKSIRGKNDFIAKAFGDETIWLNNNPNCLELFDIFYNVFKSHSFTCENKIIRCELESKAAASEIYNTLLTKLSTAFPYIKDVLLTNIEMTNPKNLGDPFVLTVNTNKIFELEFELRENIISSYFCSKKEKIFLADVSGLENWEEDRSREFNDVKMRNVVLINDYKPEFPEGMTIGVLLKIRNFAEPQNEEKMEDDILPYYKAFYSTEENSKYNDWGMAVTCSLSGEALDVLETITDEEKAMPVSEHPKLSTIKLGELSIRASEVRKRMEEIMRFKLSDPGDHKQSDLTQSSRPGFFRGGEMNFFGFIERKIDVILERIKKNRADLKSVSSSTSAPDTSFETILTDDEQFNNLVQLLENCKKAKFISLEDREILADLIEKIGTYTRYRLIELLAFYDEMQFPMESFKKDVAMTHQLDDSKRSKP